MFPIVKKRVLNETVTLMEIEAPLVARKALPGQFIIFRIDEEGERIPLTIAGYDREKGTVTIIFQKVGYTTMKLDTLNEGDALAWTRLTTGNDMLIVATRNGQAIRFNEADARPMGRSGHGVRAIKLAEGDENVRDMDYHFLSDSLEVQLKLVRDKIEQLQLVEKAIEDTSGEIREYHTVNWNKMLELIHLTGMENAVKKQYQNATNIASRIRLHRLYSVNKEGWFPWIYRNLELKNGLKVLEIGCGNGMLWKENIQKIPDSISITLSDLSEGMLRDARRNIGQKDKRFEFKILDAEKIPFMAETFDLVIANHMLFYCENLSQTCREVARVLKKSGRFICSTYGKKHMKEVSELAKGFDNRIVLSADNLYEKFGKENGKEILKPYFHEISWQEYKDKLEIQDAEPLIAYILSCHGNQNQYILSRYQEFRDYVKQKAGKGYDVTKEAGIFVCRK